MVSSASLTVTPQSLANPFFVLPYAIEKLRVLALRRSEPNLSLSIGAGASPLALFHSSSTYARDTTHNVSRGRRVRRPCMD